MQASLHQLREESSGRIVVARLEIARTLWQQTVGLLGRKRLASDGGMWIEPCNSIHTFGMQFSIDVLFLDAAGCIVRAVAGMRPWRVCLPVWKARVVVELPEGAIERWNIQPGKRYHIVR